MRRISQGFPTPEPRFAPYPFYYRHQTPEVIRWEWLHFPYDARQRKFYEIFCGRCQGSIWQDECDPLLIHPSADISQRRAMMSDVKAWSLPHIDRDTGYMNQANAYNNYITPSNNYRPANPYTGRAADATDIDLLYIAPRVTLDACMFRISMNIPAPSSLAGLFYFVGFEINSQGGSTIIALENVGNANRWVLTAMQPAHYSHNFGYGARSLGDVFPVTINNPGVWCNYYLVWDPPIFRFIQPTAGQTDPMQYPDMTETSIPGLSRSASVQPFIANESTVLTAARTWHVGEWAIWPLYQHPNTHVVHKRSNAIQACGDYEVIFDTGGRAFLAVYIEARGTTDIYEIYWTGMGEDQVANYPEVRTWRRIDDNDWTGVVDANGIASIGLFNAARFIKVKIARQQYAHTVSTLETIALTANAGSAS